MSMEKVNEFIQEEMKKRELSDDMSALRKEVYEKVIIKKAQFLSLEEAVKAIKFAQVAAPEVESKLNDIKVELEDNKKALTERFENLIKEENKEDFVKVLKKTKFIHREPLNYKIFNNLRPETINIIKEATNEELLLLSPYKVADLVQSESKLPIIAKFVDLYKPATFGTEVDDWITTYAKKMEEAQQIRVHFAELPNVGFFTEDMVLDIAVRWSIMLGLSGDMKNNPETNEPNDPEMQNAVKEVSAIIKNNVVIF